MNSQLVDYFNYALVFIWGALLLVMIYGFALGILSSFSRTLPVKKGRMQYQMYCLGGGLVRVAFIFFGWYMINSKCGSI